jgi:hypothetical protein
MKIQRVVYAATEMGLRQSLIEEERLPLLEGAGDSSGSEFETTTNGLGLPLTIFYDIERPDRSVGLSGGVIINGMRVREGAEEAWIDVSKLDRAALSQWSDIIWNDLVEEEAEARRPGWERARRLGVD